MTKGCVYWITGLAGAGKTTIGSALYKRLKMEHKAVVLLDGDMLREAFDGVFGYTLDERKKCAMSYSRLCKLLSDQGIIVIICTISMFDTVRDWNRENISGYLEIFVNVSNETLIKRNQKGLYTGDEKSVYGVDIQVELPKNPDIVLENDGTVSPDKLIELILSHTHKL